MSAFSLVCRARSVPAHVRAVRSDPARRPADDRYTIPGRAEIIPLRGMQRARRHRAGAQMERRHQTFRQAQGNAN